MHPLCLVSLCWRGIAWQDVSEKENKIFSDILSIQEPSLLNLPYFCFSFIFYQHLQKVFHFADISERFFLTDQFYINSLHSRNNAYDLTNESHATNNELWMVEVKREVTSLMQHLNPVCNIKWMCLDSVLCIFANKLATFLVSMTQKGMSLISLCFLLSIPRFPIY